jgi:hypothetical protein
MTTKKLATLLAGALGLMLMLALPGQAAARDRNHDRIPDRWEHKHHLSLRVDQARRDQDRDGLANRGEFMATDLPHDPDTDNDAIEDGDENAGTIQSFDADTGRLVINLFAGDTLSGQVTPDTEIKCENENENEAEDNDQNEDRLAREDGSSEDNSGPGSDNSEPGNADDQEDNCTTADLTPGRTVEEAELHTEGGAAVFEEVELR